MENLVPLGTGNSRFMKSNISPSTTLDQLIQMLNNGTFPYDIGPLNSAGISQQGTPLNKDTLLKDATAALFGFGVDALPDDMFNVLTHAGDLHVWKRIVQNDDGIPASYELGEVQNGEFYLTNKLNQSEIASYQYSTAVSVSDGGVISLVSPTSLNLQGTMNTSNAQVLQGKFIKTSSSSTDFTKNKIYFIPSNAQFTRHNHSGQNYALVVKQIQDVTSTPFIPAGPIVDYPVHPNRNAYQEGTSGNTTIEYMGQLGDKTGVKTGEYTGTGSYGSANATSLTFDRIPSLLIVQSLSNEEYGMTAIIIPKALSGIMLYNQSGASVNPLVIVSHGPKVSWYSAVNATIQMNYKYDKYCYTAFL